MASPQLGGATSFFSDASRPGVHIKGWKAAGIKDRGPQGPGGNLGLPPELRLKSLSTNDLVYLATSPPPSSHPPHTPFSFASSHRHRRGQPRRGKGIHSRLSTSSGIADGNGMNTLPEATGSHDQSLKSCDQRGGAGRRGSQSKGEVEEGNTSLLKQVGNLFSWSTLGLGSGGGGRNKSGSGRENQTAGAVNSTDSVDSPPERRGNSSDVGLAGIL